MTPPPSGPPDLIAIVDASYDAGFAAWASIVGGQQHVRSGPAGSSTEAELLAAQLAVDCSPAACTHLDIRTDCEATVHHVHWRTPTAAPLLRRAAKRQLLVTVTAVPRPEVRAAHDLAYRTFLHKRRAAPLRHVTGAFAVPATGGVQVAFPGEGIDVHEPLTAPLGQVGVQAIARAASRLPPGVQAALTGVPDRIRDLWGRPTDPWHPCGAYVTAQHLALLDRGVTLGFA